MAEQFFAGFNFQEPQLKPIDVGFPGFTVIDRPDIKLADISRRGIERVTIKE
jgi:hypothetical protein